MERQKINMLIDHTFNSFMTQLTLRDQYAHFLIFIKGLIYIFLILFVFVIFKNTSEKMISWSTVAINYLNIESPSTSLWRDFP